MMSPPPELLIRQIDLPSTSTSCGNAPLPASGPMDPASSLVIKVQAPVNGSLVGDAVMRGAATLAKAIAESLPESCVRTIRRPSPRRTYSSWVVGLKTAASPSDGTASVPVTAAAASNASVPPVATNVSRTMTSPPPLLYRQTD